MVEWECEVCGYVHRNKEPPETCPVCESEKERFKRIDHPESEEVEIPKRKKKYRRIFKKGFTRKYKKYKK